MACEYGPMAAGASVLQIHQVNWKRGGEASSVIRSGSKAESTRKHSDRYVGDCRDAEERNSGQQKSTCWVHSRHLFDNANERKKKNGDLNF